MTWLLSAFTDEAGKSTEEQITASQRGGLRYIDPRSLDGYNITELPLNRAEQVAKAYQEAGIQVHMYGSPIGKIDITDGVDIDLKKLDHLGQLKAIFGASGVRIFSYYNKTKKPTDQWRQETLDRLRRLQDRAGQLGLVLFHENESDIFGDHPDNIAQIAELRDGDTFKLIYDFANYLRTGTDPWQTWQQFKDQTDCFHFKDARHNGEHMPMGQGDTEARRILQDAADAGWSGPCVLEPHLRHNQAVLATGASGTGNQTLATHTEAEIFQHALDAANTLLRDIGVND